MFVATSNEYYVKQSVAIVKTSRMIYNFFLDSPSQIDQQNISAIFLFESK